MNDVKAIAVPWPVPIVLSVVAGYVDSCTYLGLFGVFVAQVPEHCWSRTSRTRLRNYSPFHLSSSQAWL
jgi:hypothetical protein